MRLGDFRSVLMMRWDGRLWVRLETLIVCQSIGWRFFIAVFGDFLATFWRDNLILAILGDFQTPYRNGCFWATRRGYRL